jgi:hypothetical protein
MDRQKGRLYDPVEFHNPTAPEGENAHENVRIAARNERIKKIIQNPKILKDSSSSIAELSGLIRSLNEDLNSSSKQQLTSTALGVYAEQKSALEEIMKQMKSNSSVGQGRLKTFLRNFTKN